MHDSVLHVLGNITSLVGSIGGTRLVGVVLSSACNVLAKGLDLGTSLVGVGLVDLVLSSLLDVGANGGSVVCELVDSVLGVTWKCR